jgi:hypothetical protein
MSTLRLNFAEGRKAWRPGEEIVGTATWQLDKQPRSVEVRICWRTEGKGSEDGDVAVTIPFESPQTMETREFRFAAPREPHSFSGQILSVVWSVEIEVQPGGDIERSDIVIGPGAQKILLGKVDESPSATLPVR